MFVLTDNGGFDVTPEGLLTQNVRVFLLENREEARRLVRLEFDAERNDRFGRTFAYVYLPDATFLNAEIAKQGYGHAYTQFPFRYLEQLRVYEREAREVNRGLWAEK